MMITTTKNQREGVVLDGQWHNCYDLDWKGTIVDEAFQHPAKFSHALIRRIIHHLLEDGLIHPGDTILDPFGGVGLGALYCAKNGLQYVGIELEEKFAGLAKQNFELWRNRYAAWFPQWVEPVIIQGDSRRLVEIVGEAGCIVGSPPFEKSIQSEDKIFIAQVDKKYGQKVHNIGDNYGTTPGQLGAMPSGQVKGIVGSPPFIDERATSGRDIERTKADFKIGISNIGQNEYGQTPGQLGAMPSGLISSPPFAGNSGGRGEASRQGIDAALFDRHSGGMKKGTGENKDNLDHLPMGEIGAIVGSPPFENQIPQQDKNFNTPHQQAKNGRNESAPSVQARAYGQTPGQLGTEAGNTFWEAASMIVAQCHMILPSGAPAVWVTKRYVKNGQIVDFTANWIALCEYHGFKLIHHHKAMLVKDNGTQLGLFNINKDHRTENKSFFRRNYENKKKAQKHWKTLSRVRQAKALWEGKKECWFLYYVQLERYEKGQRENEPKKPTTNRKRSASQMIAWKDDGQPFYEIEQAIDHEDVLCFVKL